MALLCQRLHRALSDSYPGIRTGQFYRETPMTIVLYIFNELRVVASKPYCLRS